MTVEVAVATVIERPIDEVARFAGDPANVPAWSRRVSSAEWQTDPPTMLGSRITFRATVAGRPIVTSFDVVEISPPSQVALSTTASSVPTRITLTWRALSDRATHVVLSTRIDLRGIRRPLAPFASVALRRSLDRDLDQLRHLVEGRSTA